MRKSDEEFNEITAAELRALAAAYEILGVEPGANAAALKVAYRRTAMKCHPDRNPGDSNAGKKFILVRYAYELLTNGKPCELLLTEISSWPGVPKVVQNKLDNSWGYFVWWRDNYF